MCFHLGLDGREGAVRGYRVRLGRRPVHAPYLRGGGAEGAGANQRAHKGALRDRVLSGQALRKLTLESEKAIYEAYMNRVGSAALSAGEA